MSINKVEKEETFDNQNPVSHCIPTPDDNQNDIHPPVSGHEYIPRRTPPIHPLTTPLLSPSHLSSSSQVSRSGNVPDIQ